MIADGDCGLCNGLASPWLGVSVTGDGGEATVVGGPGVGVVLLTGRGGGGGSDSGDLEAVERGSVTALRAVARGSWILLDGCSGTERSSSCHRESIWARIVSLCNCCFCAHSYSGCEGS
jgi:hypothetical protein